MEGIENMQNVYFKIFSYIQSNKATLAIDVLEKQLEYQPKLRNMYSEEQFSKCIDDIKYHLSFLAEAININNIKLFEDYVLWAKVLFHNINMPTKYFIVNLKCIAEILKAKLDTESYNIVEKFINRCLDVLNNVEITYETFIKYDNPHVEVLKKYINYVLDGNRNLASKIILDYVESGVNIKEVYCYIFEPALKEVGRLWQTNKITVAQEHYFTATTQLIMAQLYSKIFSGEKNGKKFVAACVSEELHEVGIRMVADILEIDGWDTYYLGANVPKNSVIEFIKQKRPDVFGISVTVTMNLHKVIELIDEIRKDEEMSDVKILVGGYPFNIDKELWKKVGADLYAPNALEASSILSEVF
ncbi:MAG: B12-binding domain-containing protein [Fervidobacterium sp.]